MDGSRRTWLRTAPRHVALTAAAAGESRQPARSSASGASVNQCVGCEVRQS
jgi:hypothetical protein